METTLVTGTDGDDVLYGTSDADTFDVVMGNNGDDTLYGGSEESPLEDTGTDALVGGNGDDTLYGGDGDDMLTGDGSSGEGSDTFVSSFTLEEGSGGGDPLAPLSFEHWLADDNGGGGLSLADLTTQSAFASTYTHWLEYLVQDFLSEMFGIAVDAEISLNQNDPSGTPQIAGMSQENLDAVFGNATAISIKTGKISHTRYWSDLDADFWGGDSGGGTDTLVSDDGNDVITDFQKALDSLQFSVDVADDFNGTVDDLIAFFEVVEGDFSPFGDHAVNDTKVTLLGDSSMSITLQDVTFDEGDSVWNYVDFVYA